ncbi:MAG: multicopper oxidase domain-containing protein [Methylococcales bacterium]|nr:multicopper oxidase domain-containing protein [Methylococcales bacterium]
MMRSVVGRLICPGDGYHVHKPVNPDDFKKIDDISKAATDLPPPLNRDSSQTVEIKLTATEVISDVAPLIPFHYWTFHNTVPGPFLRVRVGDTIKLTLHNDKTSTHNHSIDLHAVTGSGGGAPLTEVEPGETKTMQFKALNPGLFIYHCASGNAPMHIAMGMYGMILVEPEAGLSPVDKEFYIMQGELYTKGMLGQRGYQDFDSKKMLNEQPEYIFFNGRPWLKKVN